MVLVAALFYLDGGTGLLGLQYIGRSGPHLNSRQSRKHEFRTGQGLLDYERAK